MTLKEQIAWCKAQIKSGYEVVALRSILARLQGLENKEPPHPMHNQAVAAYKEFLQRYGLPVVVDARQGTALKELLPKLQSMTESKTPAGSLNALIFILNKWDLLNQYHHKKKTLAHINQNLVEILDQIRNGATKKQSNLNEAQRFHNELTKRQ